MTGLPWLLGPGSRQSNAADLERCCLRHLGETAAVLAEVGVVSLHRSVEHFGSGVSEAGLWFAALARELMLLSRVDPRLVSQAQEACGPSAALLVPFRGGPPLREFLGHAPAAALFPVATQGGGRDGFAQVWAFKKDAWPNWRDACRHSLHEPTGLDSVAGAQYGLVIVPPNSERLVGRSWGLAAALCILASSGEGKDAVCLARRWVVTGALGEAAEASISRSVQQVDIPGKRQLAREVPQRYWLIPAANIPDAAPEWEVELAGRLHYAKDVDSAWAQVLGRGFIAGEPLSWEVPPLARPVSAHCFASNALGPMLATFLWSQPSAICIWASDAMQDEAEQFEMACKELRDDFFPSISDDSRIRVCKIPSTDLPSIRMELLGDPELGMGSSPTLFNLTGGNLLMRVALLDLARFRPNISIVYRPEKDEGLRHVCIRHPYLQPVVSEVEWTPLEDTSPTHWKELLNVNLTKVDGSKNRWADILTESVGKISRKEPSENS